MFGDIPCEVVEIIFSYPDYGSVTNLAISSKASISAIRKAYDNQDFWRRKLAPTFFLDIGVVKLIPGTTWRDLHRQLYMIGFNECPQHEVEEKCIKNIVMYSGVAQILMQMYPDVFRNNSYLLEAAKSGSVDVLRSLLEIKLGNRLNILDRYTSLCHKNSCPRITYNKEILKVLLTVYSPEINADIASNPCSRDMAIIAMRDPRFKISQCTPREIKALHHINHSFVGIAMNNDSEPADITPLLRKLASNPLDNGFAYLINHEKCCSSVVLKTLKYAIKNNYIQAIHIILQHKCVSVSEFRGIKTIKCNDETLRIQISGAHCKYY